MCFPIPIPSLHGRTQWTPVWAVVWSRFHFVATPTYSKVLSFESALFGSILHVIFERAKEQMFRISACRIIAAMKNTCAGSKFPPEKFPRSSMGKNFVSLGRPAKHSVSHVLPIAAPFPAAIIFSDKRHEAFPSISHGVTNIPQGRRDYNS